MRRQRAPFPCRVPPVARPACRMGLLTHRPRPCLPVTTHLVKFDNQHPLSPVTRSALATGSGPRDSEPVTNGVIRNSRHRVWEDLGHRPRVPSALDEERRKPREQELGTTGLPVHPGRGGQAVTGRFRAARRSSEATEGAAPHGGGGVGKGRLSGGSLSPSPWHPETPVSLQTLPNDDPCPRDDQDHPSGYLNCPPPAENRLLVFPVSFLSLLWGVGWGWKAIRTES